MGPVSKRDSRAWSALTPPLAEWILDAVSSMGFTQMTPVQAATLPHLTGNKDVVVEAVTGSGKTLAYLIPIVQRLLRAHEAHKQHHVSAIIISPTRELAAQIHTVLLSLLRFHTPSADLLPCLASDDKRPATTHPVIVPQLLVGGSTTPAQDLGFFLRHSPNLLIASPGRLVELLASPYVNCPQSSFDVLILDEADRLLDLGFKQELQSILSRLPKQRRTGLFSASVGEAVSEIIRVGLRNPVKIEVRVRMKDGGGIVQDRKIPASLRMTYTIKPASHKLPALCLLLDGLPVKPQRTIVFVSSCAAVDYFQHVLPPLLPIPFSLVPLHGKQPPKARDKNFARFLTSVSPTLLLTTDLASRGLDIPQVDLVVQIDPPSDPKAFIHRNGRAGRAGRKGLAVIMLHPGREEDYVRFLQVRKTPVDPLDDTIPLPTTDQDASAATHTMRNLVLSDRALHDKAQLAFVSWVRSHGAHQATSIFRTTDLDWPDLARAWALLRLPKMPELRRWDGDPSLGLTLDWQTYGYKSPAKEAARKAKASNPPQQQQPPPPPPSSSSSPSLRRKPTTEAWSQKHDRDRTRSLRREKRHSKRDAQRRAKMTPEERLRQSELDRLVAEVRSRNRRPVADDEFHGFDD
ncbi:DEAD-like helicase [Ophiocordyceps camponoti-floridani]|uniref:ATP-dependent RNA helicase n=1 Tax=Ophiocordyceps camponoti-floridani TaxID=2030778 RepID=A0A8H4VC42_9HYPO|nr:DEAD-like helicase [Ophiocordyceps camponoti-floridani]